MILSNKQVKIKGEYMQNLSNEKQGIHSILRLPYVYSKLQKLLGGDEVTKYLVDFFIKPISGENILDFGSGTGALFDHLNLFNNITYTGIEPNSNYTDKCKIKFKDFTNASFHTGSIDVVTSMTEEFDKITVFAVLHHLNIDSWLTILESLHSRLRKGGKLLLLDNVFHEGQNIISKTLIKFDRGQSVMHENDYKNTIRSFGFNFDSEIKTDLLRIPYSHILTTIYK
jgi:SAM-dependent methyltransferase